MHLLEARFSIVEHSKRVWCVIRDEEGCVINENSCINRFHVIEAKRAFFRRSQTILDYYLGQSPSNDLHFFRVTCPALLV